MPVKTRHSKLEVEIRVTSKALTQPFQTKEKAMTVCPIAIVSGCVKCPIFKVCPVKSVIGDYVPPSDKKPASTSKAKSAAKPKSKPASKPAAKKKA